MMIFFQAASEIINDSPNTSPLSIGVIGDSIARGTSNGVGDAVEGTLFEFNGTQLIEIVNDTLEALTGSPYPSMAESLFNFTGRLTHLINTAEGGAEFSPNGDTKNYSATGYLQGTFATRSNSYFQDQSISKFDIIIFNCGINDARGGATLSAIESDLNYALNKILTDFPNTPIILNNLGKSDADPARVTAIRGYINDAATNYALVYAGKDLNLYPSESFYDGLHLDQPANNDLGVFYANRIIELLNL